MIYIILFSSIASCIFPKHHVILRLPIILVCIFLPWPDFFYRYDVSLHVYADDTHICLWFLTSFLFLCLAGIKSLMFQNHIQLKLCKTEFLVMSSLKSEIIQFSLFIWPLLTSNFTSNRYPGGYLWLIIVFPDLICMETCFFIMETLLKCRCFSPLLMQEDFQSWFIFFRLNCWETWPFLKAGYLHSKNSPDFATSFFDTHNTSLHCLLAN